MTLNKNSSLMIVEDSQEDYYAMTRILKRKAFDYPVAHLDDGDAVVAHFKNVQSEEHNTSIPALILLDLNLPGTDGREILQMLKSQESTSTIPIVIMTTSANPQDISYCYAQGADGYFVKPVDFERLQHGLTTIIDYWFDIMTPSM